MEFWSFIKQHVARPLSVASAVESLENALSQLPEHEVLEFCNSFDQKMSQAYTWDLWGIAYLVNGGCGDDTFMDFRSSLICLGEDLFKQTLAQPESLLNLEPDELVELFVEGLLYVGPTAYEKVSGKPLSNRGAQPAEPAGQPWEETRESLMQRFPRAWERYGWEASVDTVPQTSTSNKPWWKFW